MDRRAGVKAAYDRIAPHFASTREYPWPEVESFADGVDGGEVGLDLGCGNGRHAELLAPQVERLLGIDLSRRLLETARERAAGRGVDLELVAGDAVRLPVRSNAVDVAVYVATVHHLPTRDVRLRSLDELGRVLGEGARALVSTWSTTHDRFDREQSFDTTVEWTLPGGETVDRFYHIYSPEDFERDLDASDLDLLDWRVSSGNCYATVTGSADGKRERS